MIYFNIFWFPYLLSYFQLQGASAVLTPLTSKNFTPPPPKWLKMTFHVILSHFWRAKILRWGGSILLTHPVRLYVYALLLQSLLEYPAVRYQMKPKYIILLRKTKTSELCRKILNMGITTLEYWYLCPTFEYTLYTILYIC